MFNRQRYTKKYYQKHKEYFKVKHAEWVKQMPDKSKNKILLYQKKYREENKDKIKKLIKLWREKNKNKLKKYMIKRKREHSKWFKEYSQKYYQKNREKILKYLKNRRKNDINYKLKCNLRLRLWHGIKGNVKSNSTIKLLGCSIPELRKYLENKFKFGMTWENYGKVWEIDHIKPCASFDLSKPKEQKKCFHFTNLQPLSVHKNRIKSRNKRKKKNV